MSNRRLASSALFLTASATVFACMWDQDTLVHEATAMPNVVQVAVGRFEQNPPLYYQMRIDRETPLVKLGPKRLYLYDDIGVANARLGHQDEAIAWMEKKHAVMGDLSRAKTVNGKRDAFSEAAYRYYANVGTFWLLRWADHGGKIEEIGQLKHARDLIAKAIEINPDAHFGRETVQLTVMDWLIESSGKPDAMTLAEYLGDGGEITNTHTSDDSRKRIKGLIGLITLGAAWEMPDIYDALASEMDGEYRHISKLGFFVRLREKELFESGKTSFVKRTESSLRLETLFPEEGTIRSEFKRLRTEADEWSKARTEFMMTKLNRGRHPDTDPHFWDGYVSKPAPHIEYGFFDNLDWGQRILMLLGGCCSAPFLLWFGVRLVIRRVQVRKTKATN